MFRFIGDGTDEFWVGSADLMHRNLDRRVEALVQVTDPEVRAELAEVLDTSAADRTAGFDLASDGTWHRRTGDDLIDMQEDRLRRLTGE